jgi:hypothetical protein
MKLSSLSAPHPGTFSPTEAATDAPELGTPNPTNKRPGPSPERAAERRYVAAGKGSYFGRPRAGCPWASRPCVQLTAPANLSSMG